MEDSCLLSLICEVSSGRCAAKNRRVTRFAKKPIIPSTPRSCKFRVDITFYVLSVLFRTD